MIIHYSQHIGADTVEIIGEEAKHCAKVLRARLGDEIYVTDGKGTLCHASIFEIDKECIKANIISREEQAAPSYHLTVAVCPTKHASRIEWAVEKMVEIGVHRIIIMKTKRTERSNYKEKRLQKIILSAMKQSKNLYLPELICDMPWSEVLTQEIPNKYIAHCEDVQSHLAKVCPVASDCMLAIGPEGDFTSDEVAMAQEKGWKEVNLGPTRLRTETAAVYGTTSIALMNSIGS